MDNLEKNVQFENSFITTTEINGYLLETSKWGKFLAIVGYVGLCILIILALFIMIGSSQISKFSVVGFPMGMIGFLYIIIAVIYYFPINYLYSYSVQIKQGLNSNDLSSITTGFRNLKSLFKFLGIFTIIILSIYALILVIVLPIMLLLLK
ncbi:MAG: hypothetical protein JXB49_28695 [Bacteroidales bacterium]|nr:hypothetical protein [Bacteroidales bacterium]